MQCFKLIGTGGGAVTASAKTLWWKFWLITYPWEKRGSAFPLLADWIASHSLAKEVGSPVQPLPSSPDIWNKWKCSVFSLGRDHKWCPVLAIDNASGHGGQDGWWLVQRVPVQFPPEAEMHSLLGCGTFCSSQEKMVRSLMLPICKVFVSCSTRGLCGFSETWNLEAQKSKRRPWSWTTSPQCDVLYK